MNKLLARAVLLEGITHLEDLNLEKFISAVESIKSDIITEKLDGTNLWVGVDEDRKVFTSREGKSKRANRIYDPNDYEDTARYNSFRAATAAVKKAEKLIAAHLKPNDMVEIEVLFGRQPNTVTYGAKEHNYIAFVRPVNDTPEERFRAAAKALNGQRVSATAAVITSPDGTKINKQDETHAWEFTAAATINAAKIDTREVDSAMAKLKSFLKQPNDDMPKLSNKEVAELSLSTVPKEERADAKTAREKINAEILKSFKLPIKEMLLSGLVRKIKPALQADNIDSTEDTGVEGVVVRNPDTDEQFKIVDKDVFTAINTFNSAATNQIAGLVRTRDQDAPIEMRGGVFGQAKIRIAALLGAEDLAMSSGIRRFLTKFKGSTAQETAENVAASLNITSVNSVKAKISAILENALNDIEGILDTFKKEAGQYRLTLKTGKEIGLSKTVMSRSLAGFAETKKEITEIIAAVRRSKTDVELLMALYGKTIQSLFNEGESPVNEMFKLLKSISEENGGEGGEGGGAGAEAQLATPSSTTSGAIAAYAKPLFKKGKLIHKRPRNFTKPKKFPAPVEAAIKEHTSLFKSIVTEIDNSKQMKNATDVDDMASNSDVEFKQLRNNINFNDDIDQMQVSRYLNKAHELNDEVDTIAFGLELDDGQIVKVYVNEKDAEKFEEKLAAMLGEYDDVEEVINLAANEFDIVDVEYPKNYTKDDSVDDEDIGISTDVTNSDEEESEESEESDSEEGGIGDEQPVEDDGEVVSDDELSDENEASSDEGEDETSDEDMVTLDDELPDEDETSSGEGEGEDMVTLDDELPDEGETSSDEDMVTLDDELPDEDETSSGEGEDEDEIDPETGKKKMKKDTKQEESTMASYGQQFKEKLLAEKRKAKDDEIKDDEEQDAEIAAVHEKMPTDVKKLLDAFTRRGLKAVALMLVTLGVPVSAMAVKRGDLRTSMEAAGEMFEKNGQFRLWFKKLLTAFNEAETVTENIQVSTYNERLIYTAMRALGMPASIEKIAKNQLRNAIKVKAGLLQDDAQLRVYLKTLVEMMGEDTSNLGNPHNDSEDMTPEVKEDVMVAEAEVRSVQGWVNALERVLHMYGIDNKLAAPIMARLERGVKQDKGKMLYDNDPLILQSLSRLVDAIDKFDQKQAAALQKPAQQNQSIEKSGKVISEASGDPEDMGNWNVAKMGSSGMMLKNKAMSIKLDGAHAKKLVDAMGASKDVKVKDAKGDTYHFVSISKKEYAVSQVGDKNLFPNGLLVNAKAIDEIIEA